MSENFVCFASVFEEEYTLILPIDEVRASDFVILCWYHKIVSCELLEGYSKRGGSAPMPNSIYITLKLVRSEFPLKYCWHCRTHSWLDILRMHQWYAVWLNGTDLVDSARQFRHRRFIPLSSRAFLKKMTIYLSKTLLSTPTRYTCMYVWAVATESGLNTLSVYLARPAKGLSSNQKNPFKLICEVMIESCWMWNAVGLINWFTTSSGRNACQMTLSAAHTT